MFFTTRQWTQSKKVEAGSSTISAIKTNQAESRPSIVYLNGIVETQLQKKEINV